MVFPRQRESKSSYLAKFLGPCGVLNSLAWLNLPPVSSVDGVGGFWMERVVVCHRRGVQLISTFKL